MKKLWQALLGKVPADPVPAPEEAPPPVIVRLSASQIADQAAAVIRDKGYDQLPHLLGCMTRLSWQSADFHREFLHFFENHSAAASRLLRMANSSYFVRGLRSSTNSLGQAMSWLGLSTAVEAAMAGAARSIFPVFGGKPPFDYAALFNHSLAVAIAARRIAVTICGKPPTDKTAFTIGLLHDIGIVSIGAVPAALPGFCEAATAQVMNHTRLVEEEQVRLGFNHTTCGAELAAIWAMPRIIQTTIFRHHDAVIDGSEDEMLLLHCLKTAEWICFSMGIGYSDISTDAKDEYAASWSWLGLDHGHMAPHLMESIATEIRQVERVGWFCSYSVQTAADEG